jgi:hypothetical protein
MQKSLLKEAEIVSQRRQKWGRCPIAEYQSVHGNMAKQVPLIKSKYQLVLAKYHEKAHHYLTKIAVTKIAIRHLSIIFF